MYGAYTKNWENCQCKGLYKDADFLLFSETWLDTRYTDGMISIPNYVSFRLARCKADSILINEGKVPNRVGGVIIYVKK